MLKITDGEIRIFRAGRTNGAYHADDPADNYEFPVGIYFMGVESEDVATGLIDMIYLIWDRELETWRMMFGMATATTYRHYAIVVVAAPQPRDYRIARNIRPQRVLQQKQLQ